MEIHNCKKIDDKPYTFFFQEGSSMRGRKVLILGESLAKKGWVESGHAFYTILGKILPTGKRLNEELSHIDLSLEECAFTEIAKCYIGTNRKKLASCGSLCANHLLDQIDHYKPRLIISLGVITKEILEKKLQVNFTIGKMSSITHKNKKYQLLPLYHPSPANPFGHSKNIISIKQLSQELMQLLKH